jgi:Type II secretion system (T2SS), protein G
MMDVKNIEKAMEIYNLRNNQYPQSIDVLVSRQPDGSPALLEQAVMLDPWGHPYTMNPGELHPTTGKPHVYSNGRPGSGLIIGNWQGEDGKGGRR